MAHAYPVPPPRGPKTTRPYRSARDRAKGCIIRCIGTVACPTRRLRQRGQMDASELDVGWCPNLGLPERNDGSANYNQQTSAENRQRWQRAEECKVDDLPDDEQRSDVEPNDFAKF